MSRHTVLWPRQLLSDLAVIWIESKSRNEVSAAVHEIDTTLSDDPFTKGEHLAEGLRKLQVNPLRVIFEVEEADRQVRIVKIDLIGESSD